ncbi:hypothetical protein HNQ92_004491 [Rhabdobacter roseus]|uniref:Golvesin/Xly CBD-like domain-containing protein n=1 Tax=Rhabdobacter roseus TaxID=1655419 RepID=A0A840TR27_9BACT|nr:FAD-dependent oxidoreductase [Rhabdobacter roseus]MBB5286331.1 hypothetical protein [Rhabdobacter roseus]
MKTFVQCLSSFLVMVPLFVFSQSAPTVDVLVYGGTAGGVTAAIAAAREGASVLLVEPGRHLGGMVTGGLSHTDYGDRAVIGGLALEFYERVAKAYQKPVFFWRGPEPTLGEKILRDWLKETGVSVRYGDRVKSVQKEGRKITGLQLLSGVKLTAAVFIDASYEGDLMARAGVGYAIGREGISDYGESWAGRQPFYPDKHNFPLPVSPFVNGKNGELLPLINARPQVGFGEADSAVQAYCFRVIMTNKPENRIPITRPVGYDSTRYELLRRYLKVRQPTTLAETGVFRASINLPNQKAEINSAGPISTNLYDGTNWAYPDADYALRDKIWNDHLRYTHGLLYFIANDPEVPEPVRKQAQQWGLCKDEFEDTGHWPHQLYVREARRMRGEYIMTQHDLLRDTLKYDAVAMGSYNIDVRHTQRTYHLVSRFPELLAETINEGYLSIPVSPYQIPYRALVPRYENCTNLLVPVCVSSSSLAFASVRMEPQYMALGHASGVAAALATKQQVAVQHVDIAVLQKKLREQRQVLSFEENPNGIFGQGNSVVVDDDMRRFVDRTGTWNSSENPLMARHAITYLSSPQSAPSSLVYRPYLPEAGKYKVYGWWPLGPGFATNTPLTIEHAAGKKPLTVNQRDQGGQWIELGTFQFEKGYRGSITVSNQAADGVVVADAFRFERIH